MCHHTLHHETSELVRDRYFVLSVDHESDIIGDDSLIAALSTYSLDIVLIDEDRVGPDERLKVEVLAEVCDGGWMSRRASMQYTGCA